MGGYEGWWWAYLLLEQTLSGCWLGLPDGGEIPSGLEGLEPDGETDDHGEEGADSGEVAVELQPAARGWNDHCWDGDEESEEDQYGVSNGSYLEFSIGSFS